MGGGRGRGKSGQEKDEKRRMDEEGKHFSAHLWSVAGQGKKRIILLSFFHACELLCMCVLRRLGHLSWTRERGLRHVGRRSEEKNWRGRE